MSFLFRYILAFIRLFLVALVTIFTLLLALPCFYAFGRTRSVSYVTAQIWAKFALCILNVRVRVLGNIPQDKVLLMPNHQSFLDVFIILAYYPSSIVAKKEIAKWPVLKYAIALGRIILVDRNSLSGALHVTKSIDKEVKSGGSVILFPEGTTSPGPLTIAFKAGSFKIAANSNTPIAPVAIQYLNHHMAWGNETFLHNFFMKMGYARINVELWFGDLIVSDSYIDLRLKTKEAIDKQLSTYL